LGEEESARYVRDVCWALRELHGDGVVHRDVKPENIMLCNGKAKLGDFGLAAKVSSSNKRTTFCGTLDYLAPEMFEEHEHCEKVDVWSVGVLAYELNCGKAPFAGE
jgi:serine/threonine protein kinase